MTQTEAKEFVRKHFEEFVRQKNLVNLLWSLPIMARMFRRDRPARCNR